LFNFDYQLEGRQLLTNTADESLKIRYIYNMKDINKFDALFIKILALELALDMAYEFSANNATVERVFKLLEAAEREARSIDGQERPPMRIQTNRFAVARQQAGTISKASKYLKFN
jgi:hypothetical protein